MKKVKLPNLEFKDLNDLKWNLLALKEQAEEIVNQLEGDSFNENYKQYNLEVVSCRETINKIQTKLIEFLTNKQKQ